MITGDPGTGKSVALRLLADRLRRLPDVLVGTVEHPQSRTSDFYRELGDLFGVPLAMHNGPQNGLAGDPGDVGEHFAELEVHELQRLLHVEDVGSAVGNEGRPMP